MALLTGFLAYRRRAHVQPKMGGPLEGNQGRTTGENPRAGVSRIPTDNARYQGLAGPAELTSRPLDGSLGNDFFSTDPIRIASSGTWRCLARGENLLPLPRIPSWLTFCVSSPNRRWSLRQHLRHYPPTVQHRVEQVVLNVRVALLIHSKLPSLLVTLPGFG